MPVIQISVVRAAPAGGGLRLNAWRGLMQAFAKVFDGLVPSRRIDALTELPPKWFKYPPF